ncbi:MAG: hypothetical protein ACI8UO_005033 [Verrucomicrobiales bacterium]|jgi:hypothetical protein
MAKSDPGPKQFRTRNSATQRDAPSIPDHEVLRQIGHGSFGEVWLAKAVTGVFRAVKVIHREDFDRERDFEREFEAIKKYEPISRQHPGLVHVLQVGRDDELGIYYYIMEVADDLDTGPEIDPDTYTPFTFRSQMLDSDEIDLEACIEFGAQLAEALHFLHDRDLIHRDVKLSNVIIADGQAKLADIGLVAALGDRSFVGTEGYVPPEGAGSASADIYSLGMVLYELATGKDRLDFPDVPTRFRQLDDPTLWRRINKVVCRACDRKVDMRYTDAQEMAMSLRGEEVERKPRKWPWIAGGAAAAALTTLFLVWFFGGAKKGDSDEIATSDGKSIEVLGIRNATPEGLELQIVDGEAIVTKPWEELDIAGIREDWPEVAEAHKKALNGETVWIGYGDFEPVFRITSTPSGAEVFSGEESLGFTPFSLDKRPTEGVNFEFQLAGHNFAEIPFSGENDPRKAIHVDLEPTKFPQPGAAWVNSLGLRFVPTPQGHRLEFPIDADFYIHEFALPEGRTMEGLVEMWEREGEPYPMVLLSNREYRALADWLQAKDLSEGYIGPDYTYLAKAPVDSEDVTWPKRKLTSGRANIAVAPVVIFVGKQGYGSVRITTEPSGADVFNKTGEILGTTPYDDNRIKAGLVSYEIRLAGFKPHYLDNEAVQANGLLELHAELESGETVEFGKPWVNSTMMEFYPVGEQLLVSKFETRVADYRIFCEESDNRKMPVKGHATQALHPIDAVSRQDAEAFCRWLTKRERANNFITVRHIYRLPTDVEWSRLAGLPNEPGTTPEMRNGAVDGIFPWGYDWPPPNQTGNFSDESRAREYEGFGGIVTPNSPGPAIISGYDDGFPKLSWVHEFRPNRYDLFQVSGNVWEWVSDNYSGGAAGQSGTIRGGSWETVARDELLTSYRRTLDPKASEPSVGFRVVLARSRNGS